MVPKKKLYNKLTKLFSKLLKYIALHSKLGFGVTTMCMYNI